jgi:hypothetical protein
MKTTKKTLNCKTSLKAGGISCNHVETALTIKTNTKAGGINLNHSQSR